MCTANELYSQGLRELHNANSGARTRDQISKAQQIRQTLKENTVLFQEMETLYMKEARKKKSKIGAEELETRNMFLQQFKTDLQKLKDLSTKTFSGDNSAAKAIDNDLEIGTASGVSGYNTVDFFKTLPPSGGSQSDGGVEMTSVQQQQMDQLKSRDAEFDQILDLIGEKVLEAGEKAKVINQETAIQMEMLDKLEENLEKTKEKVNSVNVSMKTNLEDKGMGMERFCINLMCFIILLGLVGVIVNVV